MSALAAWFWLRWLIGVPVRRRFVGLGGSPTTRKLLSSPPRSTASRSAALYFLVASGFTLVFGLMRNVNLAHGSLYLLGAYVGWMVGDGPDSWLLAVAAGFLSAALVGLLLQIVVFRFMQGEDLRQTLVDHRLSIVLADLMLWIWGGQIYQFDPPRWIIGSTRAADRRQVPDLPAGPAGHAPSSSASLLWLFLNRTRVGMMIRAGVDDRGMLAASGVNVQMVFAITFAIGAGLAGFAGVVGGTALSIAPGEDTRYLLASLVVVIVGGMGSVVGRRARRAADRPRRAVRPRLCADLRHRVHLRDHGAGAGLPAAGHPGEARMSAAHWRKAMNFTARQPQLVAAAARRPHLGRAATAAAAPSADVLQAVAPRRHRATSSCWPRCSSIPGSCTPFFTFQIGGQSLILGLIALSLTFLAGYGGMVSLAQMTVAGIAGYIVAIFGRQRHAGDQPRLAVVAGRRAGAVDRRHARGHVDRLALGAHRGHLHDHDHARDRHGVLLPRAAELRDLQRLPGLPAGRCRRCVLGIDWRDAVPFYYLALFWALAGYFFVKYLRRARRSASRCRASATTRGA